MGIQVGMNGRFFSSNWRPSLQEIAFAAAHGFEAIQWRGPMAGLRDEDLGAPAEQVAAVLQRTGITAVMELLIRVTADGALADGVGRPIDVLNANLQMIEALGMTAVHWHLVPAHRFEVGQAEVVEMGLRPQLADGVALGQAHGFRFGLEHNEPKIGLFATPEACAAVLEAVEGLGFVWDFNHVRPEQFEAFAALAPFVSMVHISDTRWPLVNDHLPLGLGSLDVRPFLEVLEGVGFDGVGILEIGGLPASGGYGRDTDEALVESLGYLRGLG